MPSAKFEKDLPVIKQHWLNFISLVKQDLDNNLEKQNDIIMQIKNLERVNKILEHKGNDIEFLLLHKESILELDGSLERKLSILERFKSFKNLDNAVAIRTFKEVLASDKVKNCSNLKEQLEEERKVLQATQDDYQNLILEESFKPALISELCAKHKLGAMACNAILMYPIIKTLKKEDKKKETKDEWQVEVEFLDDFKEESKNYKEDFDKHNAYYEQVKEQIKDLINKYYVIINSMTPYEIEFYRTYTSLTNELLQEEIKDQYETVVARIYALKLFDAKEEIDKIINNLVASNYANKEDIDYMLAYVNEFAYLGSKLREYNNKIAQTEEELNMANQEKVFFLTDRIMNPIIPEEILKNGFLRDLLITLENGNNDLNKNNIKQLKIYDKKFKDNCGKPVLAIRDDKIIASYIKLKADDKIMILAASLLNPNTIQADTNQVIKEYRDQIIRQMSAIEKDDPQQLGIQLMIRDEIIKQENLNVGEGDKKWKRS